MNNSWRRLCLNCAWLRTLLRVSVACVLCRSFGGRNGKDSAFAPTISQWSSGLVVDIEKGPWSCSFVLTVSACTHQHPSRRKETLCLQYGGSLGKTCISISSELHTGHLDKGWKLGKHTQQNPSMEYVITRDYKSIKSLWKSHSDLCISYASSLWRLRKITLRIRYSYF